MKIAIPRPDDPEMAALWDKAKRAVEARQQWPDRHRERVEIMRRVLAGAPDDATPTPSGDDDCCVGDRSRCRCEAGARQLAVTDDIVEEQDDE